MIDREATERMEDADANIRELEAQCAAMRDALDKLRISTPHTCHTHKHLPCGGCSAVDITSPALSGDAGRALLERVEALDRVAEEVRASIVRPESALGEAMAALDALETKP